MTELAIKSILTLIAISGLMYLILKLMKKFLPEHIKISSKGLVPIKINAISYIDSSSKIVNFRCRNKDYLILIGKNNNILIDSYETHQD